MIFLRTYFWQTAPFWKRFMPDMALWQEPLLQRYGVTLAAWFRVQTTFVDTMRRVAKAMHTSAIGLPIGTAPGVLLGNAVLQHKVIPLSFADAVDSHKLQNMGLAHSPLRLGLLGKAPHGFSGLCD